MKRKKIEDYSDMRESSTVFRKVLDLICKPNNTTHVAIAFLAVAFGFALNSLERMPLFHYKAPFGFLLYIILAYAIKYFKRKSNDILMEFTGDPNLFRCQKKYTKRVNSNCNFFFCFLACAYFVIISFSLDFIKFNYIGIYSAIGLCVVVFGAFIVFQQYIYILLLEYDISKISPNNYYQIIPERTRWLQLLEVLSSVYRDIFILAGSLFVLLFILFSPINSIQVLFQDTLSSPLFIPLLCTWIIILTAIVAMIPFSSFIRYRLLTKICNNLTSQSIESYNNLLKATTNANRLIYMDIMLKLNEKKYTVQRSYAWLVPIFASLVNASSVLISTVADLKELGLFP
jgi:hypothetical protein